MTATKHPTTRTTRPEYDDRPRLTPEPPPRYRLAGGKVAVPTPTRWARTAVGGALWCGAAPLALRLLGRLGARGLSARAQRGWARGVARSLDLRLDLTGLDRIDQREAYIVVPLHEGFADALALLHLPLPLRFVARDELFGWRHLGPALRDTGQVLIWPEDGVRSYRTLLRRAPAILAGGESLVLFPQGSILGIEIDFLRGPFALARALGRPLLPIALTGAHRVWEYPYTPRLRHGQRMSLRVLPPVPAVVVQSLSAERLRATVQRQLKAIALSGELIPPRRFVPARDGYWDGYAYRIDPAFPALAAEIAAHRQKG
jgi:1-acyl-sn-glycerol-3-phosphate acyltransferase